MLRALCAGLLAASITCFSVAAADAQTTTARPSTAAPAAGARLTARAPDLRPIPSRIEHGVVSVRNSGSAASVPSVITVNCHLPGEEGGCVDVPERLIAAYEDAAFPNMLVVQVPAIQPGHVYNHALTFWDDIVWPSTPISSTSPLTRAAPTRKPTKATIPARTPGSCLDPTAAGRLITPCK